MFQTSQARIGLLLMSILMLAQSSSQAADSDQLKSECEALLVQQWQALSNESYSAANKMLDRARQKGCLRQPLASQLCSIPADQEAIHAESGNTTLVNIARNQQRFLGCDL
jgi:hypothetical protein